MEILGKHSAMAVMKSLRWLANIREKSAYMEIQDLPRVFPEFPILLITHMQKYGQLLLIHPFHIDPNLTAA